MKSPTILGEAKTEKIIKNPCLLYEIIRGQLGVGTQATCSEQKYRTRVARPRLKLCQQLNPSHTTSWLRASIARSAENPPSSTTNNKHATYLHLFNYMLRYFTSCMPFINIRNTSLKRKYYQGGENSKDSNFSSTSFTFYRFFNQIHKMSAGQDGVHIFARVSICLFVLARPLTKQKIIQTRNSVHTLTITQSVKRLIYEVEINILIMR